MPEEGAENIIAAVIKAIGKKVNVDKFEDRLLLQKGCFILNDRGISPKYRFGMYVRGPYSSDLANDYYEILEEKIPDETTVPEECIKELSDLIKKGTGFLEAYATLRLASRHNPKMDKDKLIKFVSGVKPTLKEKIREASEYLTFPYAI